MNPSKGYMIRTCTLAAFSEGSHIFLEFRLKEVTWLQSAIKYTFSEIISSKFTLLHRVNAIPFWIVTK